MLVELWNNAKRAWSRFNDYFMWAQPRAPIPTFNSPQEASNYLMTKYKYTGDPFKGAADFFLHPERLQAAMLNPLMFRHLSVDCDDVASWAYAALSKIPHVYPTILTLEDGSGKFMHHVICVFEKKSDHGSVYGAIDTNGYTLLRDLKESTICAQWTATYAREKPEYVRAVPTEYPFE